MKAREQSQTSRGDILRPLGLPLEAMHLFVCVYVNMFPIADIPGCTGFPFAHSLANQ